MNLLQGRLRSKFCAGLVTLVTIAVAGAGSPVQAQDETAGARGDSLATLESTAEIAADRSTTTEVAADRSTTTEDEGGVLRSPTGVAFRSLLIPGWGQATNGEWIKAGIVVGVEGFLIVRFFQDAKTLDGLVQGTPEFEQAQDNLIGSAFWLGGVVLISMLDAYIGAHLKGVDAKIEPEPQEMGVSLRLQTRF